MKRFYQLLLSAALILGVYAAYAQENIEITPPPTAGEQTAGTSAQEFVEKKSTATQTVPEGWVKTGEVSILDVETGEFVTTSDYGPPPPSIADLYMEGGYIGMSLITMCLIAMLFAAWKAPRWVKELGALALAIGIAYCLLGFYDISGVIAKTGDSIPSSVWFSGVRVALIAPIYSLIVYGVSLILRIVVKPRI